MQTKLLHAICIHSGIFVHAQLFEKTQLYTFMAVADIISIALFDVIDCSTLQHSSDMGFAVVKVNCAAPPAKTEAAA